MQPISAGGDAWRSAVGREMHVSQRHHVQDDLPRPVRIMLVPATPSRMRLRATAGSPAMPG
jgi:hypothetical protein